MKSNPSRAACVVAVVAAAALVAPAAQGRHGPGENRLVVGAGSTAVSSSSDQQDRLGPKYVTPHVPSVPAPTPIVTVVKPAGFHWADASIGAGVAGLAIALLGAGAIRVTRRSRTGVGRERSGAASRAELAATRR